MPVCTFLRGDYLYLPRPYRTHPKGSPLQGPIPPIRGKCPEGTKGVGMLAAVRLTERLLQICREIPKPQIQFAVWKGRNEHRG